MKKLLLLLLFSITLYAQPPGLLNPYSICDDNNDGFATFDLLSTDPINSLGLDPTIFSVTFHPSVVDAQNNSNEISNPSNYTNVISNSQVIGVRFVNSSNNEVNVSGMEISATPIISPIFALPNSICEGENFSLPSTSTNGITGTWSPFFNNTFTTVYTFTPDFTQCAVLTSLEVFVNSLPIANPATLIFCSPNELPIYNLDDAIGQIINGSTANFVTFHETETDAEIGTNPIINSVYVPTISPGVQILFARVENAATGCSRVTTLTLNTQNCTFNCSTPSNVMVTNNTDTSLTISWTTNSTSGGYFTRVAILPLGEVPSNTNSFIVSAPASQYTITGLSPNSCYNVFVQTVCDVATSNWSQPLSTCTYDCTNTGNCPSYMTLIAFIDENNNGIQEPDELNFNNGNFVYQINDSGTSILGSLNNGTYIIYDTNPTNSYDINFQLSNFLNGYYLSNTSYTNIFIPSGSSSTVLYFPVTINQDFVDASIYLYNQIPPRPGFTYTVPIYYRNHGAQSIQNGTLTFTKDPNVTITNISPSGAILTPTGFSYNFTNLGPNESRYIFVTLQVPTIPTVALGQLLNYSASVQVAGDVLASNNTSSLTQTIVGSYDPNDKFESHGGKIVFDNFTNDDYLYYTIRFENTGTANAEFVRIEDTLNSQLEPNSFELIAASHEVNARRNGNQLTFFFYDIDLPPTQNDPIASQGFVHFKIKPKPGFALGDIIPNGAEIYFDFNPAIITNRFETEFVQTLSNTTFEANEIALFPNPSTNDVTIQLLNNQNIKQVQFFDVSGKKIHSIDNIANWQTTIDISHFEKGLYFIEITSTTDAKQTKKLIKK